LLAGASLTADQIQAAARTAAAESRPIDDAKGSAWYRRHMVEVLVRRALTSLGGGA
ncbi:MAG: xanthine dehydrogenase family protein subunit M, partial [Caldilineales bacterium]|nr:xanthine dehydrogenase family protein subunit M [Caldilineales bacterium]